MRFFGRDHEDGWGGRRRFAHGRHHGHGGGHGEEHGRHTRDERMRFGRGGRIARFLEHGDLRLLVLHLIAEQPRHGYEIIKAIEDMTGGAYAPSPGVVYPTLTLLEELGQVTATAEGSRKRYTITEDGSAALAAERATVDAMLERIGRAQGGGETALPVIRAMENLRTTMRLKLGRGAAPETLQKIADALDACAKQVEGF